MVSVEASEYRDYWLIDQFFNALHQITMPRIATPMDGTRFRALAAVLERHELPF